MGSRSPRIAIVGKGALGLLYGSRAARALGPDAVVYAMDAGRLATRTTPTRSTASPSFFAI